MKTKTVHYIDEEEVEEKDLVHYECHNCGNCIEGYNWGFREDAYGHYYCDSERECRSEEEEVAEEEE